MRKLDDSSKDSDSENSWSEGSQSVIDALNRENEDSEIDTLKCPPNRLFIGVIDINKCEEDAQSLYEKLLEEGQHFDAKFWIQVHRNKEEKNAINLPRTEEELKEFEKVYKDVSNALKFYDEFMPKNQYFKPHTANAKRFLHNVQFIYNASKESVSSFLGININIFTRLLRYYSKPSQSSIKIFMKKQADKARFDSEIVKESEKLIKTKMRQWI